MTSAAARTSTRPSTDRKLPYAFEPTPRLIRLLRRSGKLKAADAEVLGILLDYRRLFPDSCWCSKQTIARELDISERSVQYALERLAKAGVIHQVQVSGPGQPDPSEPRNRTGWRIYFLFITNRRDLGPGPDRRPPAERKRLDDACNDPPEMRQLFASSPAAEMRQDPAPPDGARFCFESQTEASLDFTTTTPGDSAGIVAPEPESSSFSASLPDEDPEPESPVAEAFPTVPARQIPAAAAVAGAAEAPAELVQAAAEVIPGASPEWLRGLLSDCGQHGLALALLAIAWVKARLEHPKPNMRPTSPRGYAKSAVNGSLGKPGWRSRLDSGQTTLTDIAAEVRASPRRQHITPKRENYNPGPDRKTRETELRNDQARDERLRSCLGTPARSGTGIDPDRRRSRESWCAALPEGARGRVHQGPRGQATRVSQPERSPSWNRRKNARRSPP